jgi:hypothetical protein
MAEPHSTPFLGHVRQPDACFVGLLAHPDQSIEPLTAVEARMPVFTVDFCTLGRDHVSDEGSYSVA